MLQSEGAEIYFRKVELQPLARGRRTWAAVIPRLPLS